MVSLMPLKLVEVKHGELPSCYWCRISAAVALWEPFRGYSQQRKHINAWKGSITGFNMVLAASLVSSYCLSYKELKHERCRSTSVERSALIT
ncbi:ATP synthase subunit f, mitochondrial-like [Onychomys torridus]|uniref:ATP synthase subunit f, mitochondrial-like n=1 Tax=Onychomys torridus TaxID=38674 RepID=UPI00167F90BD|nr:ATP synthase subunit f, mitochondrial-like [Onychomys torridus]